MDELTELRKAIAFRRYELTGCCDEKINWTQAGKILLHFLDRRTECGWWQKDDEDLRSLYGDLIYGETKTSDSSRPEESGSHNQSAGFDKDTA